VPLDSVIVEVVEDSEAALPSPVDGLLSVVGLGPLVVAGVGPGADGPRGVVLVGGEDLSVGAGPEPAENVDGLKVLAFFAPGEVTQSAGGPDVGDVTLLDEVEDHLVLLVGLDGNGVHAGLATLVPRLQPVDLLARHRLVGLGAVLAVHLVLLVPREVVPVVAELPLLGAVLAELQLGEGEKGPLLLGLGGGSGASGCSGSSRGSS